MTAIHQNPLSRLSDSQLIKKLDTLVQKERETTLEVIGHIIEFDRRKLHLGIGYGSLYDYCTLHLGFSESAAMRRIKTARCIREFPGILSLLKKNELNLTSVCMLAGILTEDNKKELFREARCKSKRQIEAIVGRYKPGKDINDRVRTIFVKTVPQAAAETSKSVNMGNSNSQDSKCQNWGKFTTAGGGENCAGNELLRTGTSRSAHVQATVLKKKFKLEFAVDPHCMKKLEEAKAILSKKYPQGVSLGTLLDEALDAYLNKHSSDRKKKRREERRAKSKNNEQTISKPRNNNQGMAKEYQPRKRKNFCTYIQSRHIPKSMHDAVFVRDEGRCTFVGPDGRRCNSTWNIEIDHVIPYAKGGDHSIGNLRLLCAKHNMHEAKKCYGKEYIIRRMKRQIPKQA